MKTLKVLMSALILLASLSCSKGEDGDLSIEMIGHSAMMIDTEAQSCSNKLAVTLAPASNTVTKDIASQYFSFIGLTMSWKNLTDTAYIVKMDIEFSGGNLNHKCSINGDELLALFYDRTAGTWDGSLTKASAAETPTTKTTWSECKIVCGGAKPLDPKRPFTATGTLTVKGFQRGPAPDYEEKPFKASAPIRVEYSP